MRVDGIYPFLRRLIGAGMVVLAASMLAFILLGLIPGDAALTLGGDSATTEGVEALRSELGLDQPLPIRYFHYLKAVVLHGDFGQSWVSGRDVASLVYEKMGNTLLLTFSAATIAIIAGLILGMLSAMYSGTTLDLLVTCITSFLLATPSFFMALIFMSIFSLRMHWFPVAGGGTLSHLMLPMLTLAIPMTATIARLSRTLLLETSEREFVVAAYAKGLNKRQVWGKHVLRNALNPVIAYIGVHLGHLIGGVFIIETIYSWPGLGRLMVSSIFDKDQPVTLAAILIVVILYQGISLVVDTINSSLDPRIRETIIA